MQLWLSCTWPGGFWAVWSPAHCCFPLTVPGEGHAVGVHAVAQAPRRHPDSRGGGSSAGGRADHGPTKWQLVCLRKRTVVILLWGPLRAAGQPQAGLWCWTLHRHLCLWPELKCPPCSCQVSTRKAGGGTWWGHLDESFHLCGYLSLLQLVVQDPRQPRVPALKEMLLSGWHGALVPAHSLPFSPALALCLE